MNQTLQSHLDWLAAHLVFAQWVSFVSTVLVMERLAQVVVITRGDVLLAKSARERSPVLVKSRAVFPRVGHARTRKGAAMLIQIARKVSDVSTACATTIQPKVAVFTMMIVPET